MDNKKSNIILGNGDFTVEITNTNLMEWEGIQLHAYLTTYLDKIMEKNKLSPLNTNHVKSITLVNQELLETKKQIDLIELKIKNNTDKHYKIKLEKDLEKLIENSKTLSNKILAITNSYYADSELQLDDEKRQAEYQKVSPQLVKDIYEAKQEIVLTFLKNKNYTNVDLVLKNSTAGQTNNLVSAIVSNEENNLLHDFFQLLTLTKS